MSFNGAVGSWARVNVVHLVNEDSEACKNVYQGYRMSIGKEEWQKAQDLDVYGIWMFDPLSSSTTRTIHTEDKSSILCF